jgi:toxin ParE1/3/4
MSSHKFRLELASHARTDIRNILSYTVETWGERQAYEYGVVLDNALATIEQTPKIGHTKPDLEDEILCYRAGQHLIFYRIDGSTVYVLRVLHSRMDYAHHLDETTH